MSEARGRGRIRVLPPEVIAQIAAGEVVERPFSVVKELVENSLDAGADQLRVEIKDGGLTSIRVTDNGRGFQPEDLELAFISHATSKLSELADLDHVASLGFRGEALASIGSVSRCRIKSRPTGAGGKAAAEGAEIRCDGGAIEPLRPCGTPPGTVIEVRELFFNTPARRRFLKSARAERARIQDLLIRTTLPRLDVDVTLVSEDKVALHLPAGETLAQRVVRAFGRTYEGGLWEVGPTQRGRFVVHGLVAEPERSRKDSTLELTWVNGRAARDRSTLYSVRQAFRGHLLHGRYPVYFLMLDVPPDTVDVNVHPTKVEVRFAEARAVAGLMHEAVASALHARGGRGLSVGSASGTTETEGRAERAAGEVGGDGDSVERPGGRRTDRPRARAGFPTRGLFGETETAWSGRPAETRMPSADETGERVGGDAVAEQTGSGDSATEHSISGSLAEGARRHPFRTDSGNSFDKLAFLQVQNLYLVVPTSEGFAVVDQHALHERVVYERLTRRHDASPPDVQRLLVPAVVELPAPDKEWLLRAAEDLASEGLLVEDFGGQAVAVQGIPAALGQRADPERLIHALVDGSERPSARDEVLERFHSMACRGSVMSGDRLDESEVRALLEEAATLEHPHNCPHGRPTVLQFDSAELERWFRRRV